MFHQIMVYAVMLFLFAATGFARPLEPSTDKRPTESSLIAIGGWISANFELPNATDVPKVEFVPAAQLHRLRYRSLLPNRAQAIGGEYSTPLPAIQRELVAVYDDSTRTIYLADSWTGESLVDQSVLVHEMVHHLQNRAGVKYECGGAREKPAYLAQAKWLEDRGLKLEDEMQVDMFTIVAMSACMY